MLELDPEHDILEAFACFDEGDKGWVDVREMRQWLSELGDRMTDKEVSGDGEICSVAHAKIDRLFMGPFTDRQGRFNYVDFAKTLRVNDGEPERDDKLTT